MKISKKFIIILKVFFAFSLILFLFKRLNLAEVKQILLNINLSYLILGTIFYLLIMFLQAYRWQLLLGIHNIKFSVGKLVRLTFIGYFFNNFLPTTVGGDVVKGYLVAKETNKIAESYVSVLMDRIMGIIGLIVIAFLMLFFLPLVEINRTVIYIIWGAFIFFVILLLFLALAAKHKSKWLVFLIRLFQKLKIENKVKRIYEVFYSHKRYKGVLIKTVVLSLIVQAGFIIVNYFVVQGLTLSQRIPLIYFFIYTPTIALISSLPITINGIGVRENLYVEFFSRFLGKEVAGSLSIVLLIFLWAAGIVGGICYLFSNFRIPSLKTLVEKEPVKL